MPSPAHVAALALSLLASAVSIGAEEPERPKVCLVLSGGGALGLAHIGVLEVMEELRVPVDCVTGTSMGSIIGGLYAAGLSPAEMVGVLQGTDWRSVLDDRPPRRQVPFRRKVDDLTYLTRLEVGFNRGKIELPTGLRTGQQFGFMLQALTLSAAGVDDFDALPLPFRAVATDIETGAAVVLDHGDLGLAMRASVAVPGFFSPVELDGRLLVDGGLVDNLPVDVARTMGAEVVIAVDVGSPLRTRDELDSLSRLTGQVFSLMVRGNVAEQAPNADVLVDPDLSEFRATDFERWHEMIPLGREAARAAASELMRYTVDEATWEAWRARVRRQQPVPDRIAGIVVTSSSSADPVLLLERIRTRPGDPFDLERIRQDLERLYVLGDYESVGFFLTREPDGWLVNLEAHEKSWGPNVLRFGLNLVSDFEGEGRYGVLANYTMTRLNRLRGELKLAVEVGETPRFYGEYYQPLTLDGPVFVSAELEHQLFLFDIAGSEEYPTGSYRVRAARAGVSLGLELGRWGAIAFGPLLGNAEIQARLVAEPVPNLSLDWGGWFLRATIDQLDNPNFPQDGFLLAGQLFLSREALGADEEYNRLETYALGAATTGRHTLLGQLSWSSALGTELPVYERFQIGGLFQLSGTPQGRIGGSYALVGMLGYYYRLGSLSPAWGDGTYAGISLEAGNAWDERGDVGTGDLVKAGSVFFGADTALGPVYLAYGFNDRSQKAWYLFVGRSF